MFAILNYNYFAADEELEMSSSGSEALDFIIDDGEFVQITKEAYECYNAEEVIEAYSTFTLKVPIANITVETPQLQWWRQEGRYKKRAGNWDVEFTYEREKGDLGITIKKVD
jgi:hypothetical protein